MMKKYNKAGLWALTYSVLTVIPLSYACANMQNVEKEVAKVDVKHKVIELKKMSGQPIVIEIEEDGNMQVIELTADELADESLLSNKLAGLDPETRETVLNALNHSNPQHGGMKMLKTRLHKDGMMREIHIEHMDGELEKEHEIVVINGSDNLEFKGEIKGHHKALVKLIEKGKFTKQELDEIRAALDAKY
jgi:hypothetical protein